MRDHDRRQRAALRAYLARYEDAIGATRYRDLAELQPPPLANLAHGAAGTAYALARLGQLSRARAWARAAAAERRAGALQLAGGQPVIRPESYLFGGVGIRWVQALVAAPPARGRATVRFAADVRARTRVAEFSSGTAGHLIAASVLARVAGHHAAALADAAEALAGSLERRARGRPAGAWQPVDTMQFAHGWAGILYAILGHRQARGRDLPGWLVAALRSLAAAPPPAPYPAFESSWCNGAAGATLLWTKAFECTSKPEFLEAARASAARAIARSRGVATLCCGDAGVAYALFALHRSDPRSGWDARARAQARRAVRARELRWPSGLFHGHPGLVCLALDCLADRARGFPGVEA